MTTQRMKPKEKTPEEWEAWRKKQEVWKHNSFSGYAEMARMNMNHICCSQTATPKAKALANQIALLAAELRLALKERL